MGNSALFRRLFIFLWIFVVLHLQDLNSMSPYTFENQSSKKTLLQEQRENLQTLIQNRLQTSPQKEKEAQELLSYGSKLLEKHVNGWNEDLAFLLYFSSHSLEKTYQKIQGKSFEAAKMQLKEDFIQVKSDLEKRLDQHERKLRMVHLQEPIYGRFILHGHLLAELLILQNGRVNGALIKHFFLGDDKSYPQPLRESIEDVLRAFLHSQNLRFLLEQAKAPLPGTPSEEMVQIALALQKKEPVTDLHAKRLAFSALFAHLRQDGYVGSCFASSIGITLGENRFDYELRDFIEIIHRGVLTRHVDGKEKEFPYLMRLNAQGLKKQKTTIHLSQGVLGKQGEGLAIYSYNAISHVLDYLSIEDKQTFVQQALQRAYASRTQKVIKVSAAQLLDILAKHAFGSYRKRPREYLELKSKLNYVYRSHETHVLLRAWENILSSMAEGQEKAIFKRKVLKNTMGVMSRFLSRESRELSLDAKDLKKIKGPLITALRKELQKSLWMNYDPTIAWSSKAKDGNSSSGAFVLYQRDLSLEPYHWKRIDDGARFQGLLEQLLLDVKEKLIEKMKNERAKNLFKQLLRRARVYVQSSDFIEDILNRYNPRRARRSGGQRAYQVEKNPWVTRSGHHPNAVMKVYFGKKLKKLKKMPEDAEALFSLLALVGKEYQKSLKEAYRLNQNYLVPVTSPHHAFSLMLGKEDIASSWKKGPSSRWVQRTFYDASQSFSHLTVTSETQKKIIDRVSHILPNQYRSRFNRIAARLSPGLRYSELYNELTKIVMDLSKNPYLIEAFSSKLDSTFYKYLDTQTKQNIPIIFFADSNWKMGSNDSYFAFTISLGTGKLIIGTVSDDKSRVIIQNQSSTFFMQPGWEFFKPKL